MSGYINQAPNQILSSAGQIPSWHNIGDMTNVDLNADQPFDSGTVRERMRELRVTQKMLADELGLHQSAVSNILNGQRPVRLHEASHIYRRLGIETKHAVAFVPVIGISSAGNWREAVAMPSRLMPIPHGIGGARSFAVELKGDSMDRMIEDGSYVVVDPDQTQLFTDRVYLVENTDHETTVKQYKSNPARFVPASSNDQHPVIDMGTNPIRVIGRVVWKGSPM